MALVKEGRLVEDPFTDISADDSLDDMPSADDAAIIVSLSQWQAHRETLKNRTGPLGIRLRSEEKPAAIAPDLERFSLVALEFPIFRDGRAYSSARLLRERYGYDGELRAVGDVLPDQLHFMHRVGFNSFEIASEDALRDWEIALGEITVWYQPTRDGRPTAIEQRHSRSGSTLKKHCA